MSTDNRSNTLGMKVGLYVQVAFGLIVLFGLIGNFAGHYESSLVIFVVTTIVWACSSMLNNALNAIHVLMALKELEKSGSKHDDQPPAP